MLKLLVKSVRIVISSTIRFAFKPLCVRHRWQLPPHRQQTFHPTSAANLQQYSYVGQNCVTKEEGPSQHLVMIMVMMMVMMMMTMMVMMLMMMLVIMVTRGCGGRGRLGQSVGRFLHPAEASSSLKKSFSSAIMIWVVRIFTNLIHLHLLLGSVKDDGDEDAVILIGASRPRQEMHLRAGTRFLIQMLTIELDLNTCNDFPHSGPCPW